MTAAAVDTLAIVGAWFLAACTVGAAWALWRGHRQRRTGRCPAAGDGQPPVPGTPPPLGAHTAAHPPARPSPAPGSHGTKLLSADFYEDGTVLVHDHLRCRTTKFDAPEVDGLIDWDAELRRLRP